MEKLDLTPFGFTPTESNVYAELLSGGPSSGYSIAKRLGIARANAYQALDGLAAKAAAEVTVDRPKRYRATRSDTVLAQVIGRQSQLLDRLERQFASSPMSATEDIVKVEGQRAIVDLAMRTAAREERALRCVGTPEFLSLLAPAWRRRESDGRETTAWLIGRGKVQSIECRDEINEAALEQLFGTDVFLLAAGDTVMAARLRDLEVNGVWSSDPTMVGTVRSAIVALSGSRMENWPGF